MEVIDLTPEATTSPPVSSIVVSRQSASRTIVSLDASRTQASRPAELSGLIGDAAIVLVDGHQADACAAIAQAATAAGIPVVFDGGRWKDSHRALLRHVDVAICSGRYDPQHGDVHDYLHNLGVQHVATTDGDGPIRWSTPSGGGIVKAPAVIAVDTLGRATSSTARSASTTQPAGASQRRCRTPPRSPRHPASGSALAHHG